MDSLSTEDLQPIQPRRLQSKPIKVTEAPQALPKSIRPSHHWFRKVLAKVFRARRMDTPLRLWKRHFERFQRDFDEALKSVELFMRTTGEESTELAVDLLALREDFDKLDLRSDAPLETAEKFMQLLNQICDDAEVDRPSLNEARNHIEQLLDIEIELARRSSQAQLALRSDADAVSRRLVRNQQYDRAAVLRSAIATLDASSSALGEDVSFEALKQLVKQDRDERTNMDRTLRNQQKRLHKQDKSSQELLQAHAELAQAKPLDIALIVKLRADIIASTLREHQVMDRGRQLAAIASGHYNPEVRDKAAHPSQIWEAAAQELFNLDGPLGAQAAGEALLMRANDFERSIREVQTAFSQQAQAVDTLIREHALNSAATKLGNLPENQGDEFTALADAEISWQQELNNVYAQEYWEVNSQAEHLSKQLQQRHASLTRSLEELQRVRASQHNTLPLAAETYEQALQDQVLAVSNALATLNTQWVPQLEALNDLAAARFAPLAENLQQGREGLEAYREALGPFRAELKEARESLDELRLQITQQIEAAGQNYGDLEDGIKTLQRINGLKRKGRKSVDDLATRLLENADRCQKRELYTQALSLRRLALELSSQVELAHLMAGLPMGRIPLDTTTDPRLEQRVSQLNEQLRSIAAEVESESAQIYGQKRDWEGQYKAILALKAEALSQADAAQVYVDSWKAQDADQPSPLEHAATVHIDLYGTNLKAEADLFLNALKPKLIAQAQQHFIDEARMAERRLLRVRDHSVEQRQLENEIDINLARVDQAAQLLDSLPEEFLEQLDRLYLIPIADDVEVARVVPFEEEDTVLLSDEDDDSFNMDAFDGLIPLRPPPVQEQVIEPQAVIAERTSRLRRLSPLRRKAAQKAAIARINQGIKQAKRELTPLIDGYEEMLRSSVKNVSDWASYGSPEEKQRAGLLAGYLHEQLGAELGQLAAIKQRLQAADNGAALRQLRQEAVDYEARLKVIKQRIGQLMNTVDVQQIHYVHTDAELASNRHRRFPEWNVDIQAQLDLAGGGAIVVIDKIRDARQKIESPLSAQVELAEANEAAVQGLLGDIREHQAALAMHAEELASCGEQIRSQEVDAEATRLADIMLRVERGERPPAELRDLDRQARQIVKRSAKLLPRASEVPQEYLERSHLERLQGRMQRYVEQLGELEGDAADCYQAFMDAVANEQLNQARDAMQRFESLVQTDLAAQAQERRLREVELPELRSELTSMLATLAPDAIISRRLETAHAAMQQLNRLLSNKFVSLNRPIDEASVTASLRDVLSARAEQAQRDVGSSNAQLSALEELTDRFNENIGTRLAEALESVEEGRMPEGLHELVRDYNQAVGILRKAEAWLDQSYASDDVHSWRRANKELAKENELSKKTHDSTVRVYRSYAAEGRPAEALAALVALNDYEFAVNLAFVNAGFPASGRIPDSARPDAQLTAAVHALRDQRLAARQRLLSRRKALESPAAKTMAALKAEVEARRDQFLDLAFDMTDAVSLELALDKALIPKDQQADHALLEIARLRHELPNHLDDELLDLVQIHFVAAAEAASLRRRISQQQELEELNTRAEATERGVQQLEDCARKRRRAIEDRDFVMALVHEQRHSNLLGNWDDPAKLLKVISKPERRLSLEERPHADTSLARWRERPESQDLINLDMEHCVDLLFRATAQLKQLDFVAARRRVQAEQAKESLEISLRNCQQQAAVLKDRPGAELIAQRRQLLLRARRIQESIDQVDERILRCEEAQALTAAGVHEELFASIASYDVGEGLPEEGADLEIFRVGLSLRGIETLEAMEALLGRIGSLLQELNRM